MAGPKRSASGNETVQFEGDVDLIEALGSEILVHFSTDAHRVEAEGMYSDDAEGLEAGSITRPGDGVARMAPDTQVTIGSRIKLQMNTKRLYFFDAVTGLSIEE